MHWRWMADSRYSALTDFSTRVAPLFKELDYNLEILGATSCQSVPLACLPVQDSDSRSPSSLRL
jgi:hypothetical protein